MPSSPPARFEQLTVDRYCPCDALGDVCDINCCCDRDCSSEDVSLFSSCSVQTVSGSRQLCSRDVASYSLRSTEEGYSELQASVRQQSSSDALCVQSQNRFDGLSHSSPAIPTDRSFEGLFQQFTSFMFGSESSDQESQASPGYQLGDVMLTAGQSGQTGVFLLPAPGLTAHCVDSSPAAFLKDQSSVCSRRLVLDQDCGSLPALSMDAYTSIRLLAVSPALRTRCSLNNTETELKLSAGQTVRPSLTEPTLCANVVLKVTQTPQTPDHMTP
ncbi:tectonic-1-like [Salarias fasciatus]|uniref:tectonic-1-like n=2 Tax=Salarias fasciatus TaxID=181472 RepID=UPI001176E0D4|nr:tectonic-1-like [Salarias fasciatus]